MEGSEPSPFRIRQATVADAPAIARIDVAVWRDTYAGVLPQRLLVDLTQARRERAWAHFLMRYPGDAAVAVDSAGATVGFGSCGARRAPASSYAGEVFTLYVESEAQGRGIGRRLMLHLFGRLTRRGLPSALVWVLRDNPSRFFYERLGGKAVATRPISVGGIDVDAIAYGWRDLAAVLEAQSKAGY